MAATWVPATDERPPLLLTGSLDETVRLWSSDELTCVATNTGHCLGVVSFAAHPSGVIAASASLDSFVHVFDVDHNTTIATLEAPPSEVWKMQFDPKHKQETLRTLKKASIPLLVIRDSEDFQSWTLDKPLPCFGCGFLVGFAFPPMWYCATILYFGNYYRKDPRERAGLAASAVCAMACTIILLIVAMVLLF